MQTKNALFLLSLILLFAVFCISPFSRTLSMTFNYFEVKEGVRSLDNFDSQIQSLSHRQKKLKQEFGEIKWDSLQFESTLIKKLNYYCDSLAVEIINLNKAHVHQSPEYRLETYEITLRGGFYKTLNVLNRLENELTLCRIINASLEKKKRMRSKNPHLETRILMTHIE